MIADEVGWYTQGAAGPMLTTQAERATQIASVANQFWRTDCGLQGVAPYSWITMQQDPLNSEDWYGLADPTTGAPNASGLAYGQQIRLALGQGSSAPPQGTLPVCGSKTLTVQRSEGGVVTSSPAGIGCGSDCTQMFDAGTPVNLLAIATRGFRLTGWSGCDSTNGGQCRLTLNDNSTVAAHFVPVDPPDTRITAFKVVRRGRGVAYRFAGDGGTGHLTFSCRIDSRPFKACFRQASHATPGRHTFQVAATDEIGRTDATPATRSFKLARR
jgi:hypothetical protein